MYNSLPVNIIFYVTKIGDLILRTSFAILVVCLICVFYINWLMFFSFFAGKCHAVYWNYYCKFLNHRLPMSIFIYIIIIFNKLNIIVIVWLTMYMLSRIYCSVCLYPWHFILELIKITNHAYSFFYLNEYPR